MRLQLLALLIAVAAAGVALAYAAYSEQLKLQVDVDTGYFNMTISLGDNSDDCEQSSVDPVIARGYDPRNLTYEDIRDEARYGNKITDDKGIIVGNRLSDGTEVNVACTKSERIDDDAVKLSIKGAYPNYFWRATVYIDNLGTSTVSGKIKRIEIYDGNGNLLITIDGNNVTELSGKGQSLDLNGDGYADVKIWIDSGLGTLFRANIVPGDSSTLHFYGVVLDGAPENSTLEFTIKFVFEHYIPSNR